MTTSLPQHTPSPTRALDLAEIRESVDAVMEDFLDAKVRTASHPQLPLLAGVVRDFLSGGKRLRPVLCVIGWHAGDGVGDTTAALHLAASLEMLHASVLIHDDVIDNSETRRGRPAVHRVLAARHAADTVPVSGAARRFGVSAAILLGDLVMTWSDELLRTVQPTTQQLLAIQPVLDAMRGEVMLGQHLDLLATAAPNADVEAALVITRYKTAHYTVERPLQAGAALAGADPDLLRACSAFGIPLGEAFQLRDDLLGVFGDPACTGKPALDDLREGKHTPLIALALARADHRQAKRLRSLVGDADLTEAGAATARSILTDTGAPDTIEQMIDDRYRQALSVLSDARFRPDAAAALHALADTAVWRTS